MFTGIADEERARIEELERKAAEEEAERRRKEEQRLREEEEKRKAEELKRLEEEAVSYNLVTRLTVIVLIYSLKLMQEPLKWLKTPTTPPKLE